MDIPGGLLVKVLFSSFLASVAAASLYDVNLCFLNNPNSKKPRRRLDDLEISFAICKKDYLWIINFFVNLITETKGFTYKKLTIKKKHFVIP